MLREFPFLVDGQLKQAGASVEIRSPYDGEVVGLAYQATAEDVETAIAAAARAFREVARLPTHCRAEILSGVVKAIQADREQIALLIAREAGKPNYRADSMPYGGVKDSGLGREGVRFAIEEMTERKTLIFRQSPP